MTKASVKLTDLKLCSMKGQNFEKLLWIELKLIACYFYDISTIFYKTNKYLTQSPFKLVWAQQVVKYGFTNLIIFCISLVFRLNKISIKVKSPNGHKIEKYLLNISKIYPIHILTTAITYLKNRNFCFKYLF